MYDAIRGLLASGDFSVVERFELPERFARHDPIPRFLFDSRVGTYLHRHLKASGVSDGPLWAHQAEALEVLGCGQNVVVSTGTASGKSLIFRALAFHKALLNPRSRTLVFYPLKALAADQLHGWQRMAAGLKLDRPYVGRIDGSVPMKEREEVLQHARIVVMTPDVCHAWMMSRLSLPVVREFVRSLSTLVMDEAHTLEGVFGSNFAFLVRRLVAARNHLFRTDGAEVLQFVAATATIKEPGEHLNLLTGGTFSVVDHESDGAPQHERVIAHVECAPGDEMNIGKALQEGILSEPSEGGFITFLDSRKGVETLATEAESAVEEDPAKLVDNAAVLPYRAGYATEDRHRVEQRLQEGSLRGVVSTSALELGIDIPHLRVGFNIGVPESRKAYRQRVGRVGRTAPGAFVVVAPRDAFAKYGTSLREYHEMSVESSYLYLDNRFMQFAHGRCLTDELESIQAPPKTPARIAWPVGFRDMHAVARPGGNRPPEFDAMAALGGGSPQYGYPLRNVGEANFQLKMHANADAIGEVSQQQALRECYPGATYLHLTRAYEVTAWHTNAFQSFIRVKPTSRFRRTQPRIATWVNASLMPSDIEQGHIIQNDNGFLAECLMQVTQRVEGYVDTRTGKQWAYKELQQRNPNMKPRMRNFRTTGVLLCVKGDIFKRGHVKRTFAHRLAEIFIREFSIAPRDISAAATKISVQSLEGGGLRGDCIVVYDETYGSLRLTERLYLHFDEILHRLALAAREASPEDEVDADTVAYVCDAISEFVAADPEDPMDAQSPSELMQVFLEGSWVCYQQAGQMAVEVEVVQPTIMDNRLMYQIVAARRPNQRSSKRWVSATHIQPSADANSWSYGLWDPVSEQYVSDEVDEAP